VVFGSFDRITVEKESVSIEFMKMRLRNNSLRLRLTQTETARFVESGRIEEIIEFGVEGGQRFVYAMEWKDELEQIHAVLENNQIIVRVPKEQADRWVETSQIGMETDQETGGGKTLHILIEKDFACLEPRPGEEDSDAFPHPLAGVLPGR
jgi:hypothetical protein